MTQRLKLFRCEVCKNLVEVVIEGDGTLVCCGEDMKELTPSNKDEMKEKHAPVVENYGTSHVIKVGMQPHPMSEEHYIQFIEIISKDKRYVKRKYLYPLEKHKKMW